MVYLAQFGGFQQIIQNMQQWGFFQFLFPFLLTLAILYGVLRFSLKDTLPKSAAALISIVIAFFVMLFSDLNFQIVNFFANVSGYWLAVGTGILFIVVLLGLGGIKVADLWENKTAKWIFVLVIVVIGILIFFGAGAEQVIGIPFWATGSEFWTIIFFIVILALVMWFMGREEGGGGGETAPAGGGGNK